MSTNELHIYMSTYCLHRLCETGDGCRVFCKWCGTQCVCECHIVTVTPPEGEPLVAKHRKSDGREEVDINKERTSKMKDKSYTPEHESNMQKRDADKKVQDRLRNRE